MSLTFITLLFCLPDSYALRAELTRGRLDILEMNGVAGVANTEEEEEEEEEEG